MKQLIGSFMKKAPTSLLMALLLLVSLKAQAATTVTVDENNNVIVNQPSSVVQPVVVETVVLKQMPVVVTEESPVKNFEGMIVDIDYSRYQILVRDTDGRNREVEVKPEMVNSYRIGDYVLIHPTTSVTLITMAENPRDFEGEIIETSTSDSRILVQDTNGRQRRVHLRQGMIANFRAYDYVRIHLESNLREADTIQKISDIRNLEGNVASIDYSKSLMVVRDTNGRETTVLVRQGQINNYRSGDHVRIYLLANHEQVQVIRVIRK